MVTMAIEQASGTFGMLIRRSPAVQKVLLLTGAAAFYAGGIGFMLMLARGLAAL